MALIVEAVGQTGVVERIAVEGGRAAINAQPGLTYRILDASGRPVNASATVERLGDHLIIKGLPEETTVQLTDFFFVCTPNQPCALDLEGLGGARGETINQLSEPVAAMADGSFVLHAPESMATPVAPESEFSAKPALAGLGLLALAGGGGGGGGGSDGPPPPPPGSTTVTSPPVTNDPTPVITGTAIAGAQITVTLDIPGTGPVTFNTIADGNGDWSVDTGAATPIAGVMPAAGLPLDAPTTVRVLTGGTTEVATYQLSMDLVPPEAPVINAVTGDDLVNADEARVANPAPVTVAGTAEAGSTVVVSWHGEDQVATTDAAGNWAVTFDGQEIPDGSYLISAVATDLAGNTGAAATRAVAVVTNRPSKPIVDDVAGDNIINASESASDLAITGTTTVGTQVFVSFGGVVVDRQATLSGDGSTWSVNVSASELGQLQEGGPYQVTAYATDGTNQSAVGASEPVTVDRTPPGPPVITTADALINASGASISGTAEAGATVQVSLGGATLPPVNVDGSGNWIAVFAPGDLPADGNHTLSAVAIDAAGNSSPPGQLPVLVDTIAAAPSVALVSDTGSSGSDGITSNGTVSIAGLESGATWQYNINGGGWTTGTGTGFTLPAGSYAANAVQVLQTDPAGNTSAPGGNAIAITVDAAPPPAPSIVLTEDTGTPGDGITSNGSVTVGGLETGAIWQYSIDNGLAWTLGSGTSFNLPSGNYAAGTIQARQIDLAGNTGAAESIAIAVQVDATPPPAPPSPTLANDTGSSGSDGITNVGTMNVTGITGTSWQYSTDGGASWSAPQANTTTTFTLDPGVYGTNEVQVRQTNAAGLTGDAGMHAGAITVDTVAPGFDAITGAFVAGNVVFTFDFNEPVVGFDISDITLTATGPDPVSTSFDGSSDNYTLTIVPAIDATGSFSAVVTAGSAADLAGNGIPSASSPDQAYNTMRTIEITDLFDNVGPPPQQGSVPSGGAADDTTPTITVTLSGALQAGERVALFRNGGDTGLTGTQSGNDWEFEDTLTLDSPYTYVAQVMSGPSGILASDPWEYRLVSPP